MSHAGTRRRDGASSVPAEQHRPPKLNFATWTELAGRALRPAASSAGRKQRESRAVSWRPHGEMISMLAHGHPLVCSSSLNGRADERWVGVRAAAPLFARVVAALERRAER
jgi:hypothetical protein